MIILIGQNFSVASIEAEKRFIGLGPGEILAFLSDGKISELETMLEIKFCFFVELE